MPMRYLDKTSDEALKEVIEMLNGIGIYPSYSGAVMYLYFEMKKGGKK